MAKQTKSTLTPEALEQIEIGNETIAEMANALISADIMREEITATQKQEERERLTIEASRVAGMIQGLKISANFSDVSGTILLKKMKDEEIFKSIPNVKTWDNFCNHIGLSPSKVYEDLQNLEKFGSEFLRRVGDLGIGYRELRQLKKATSDGTLSISDNSVTIEGEVIPLSDKDELKEALENLVAEQNRKLKEKANTLETKEKRLNELAKEKQNAYEEADECKARMNDLKSELEKMKSGKLNGVDAADRPDFNLIRECENSMIILHRNLLTLANKELSEPNEQLLGGVTMMMFQLAEDIRITLSGKGGTHFERMYLSDEELENAKKLITPSDNNK